MSKHTPGPWMAVKGDVLNPDRTWGIVKYLSRESHHQIDGDDAQYPSRTEVIAEVCYADNGADEADAVLMAAAPDLLAELRFIAEYLAFHAQEPSLALPEWELVVARANAVIEKATGE